MVQVFHRLRELPTGIKVLKKKFSIKRRDARSSDSQHATPAEDAEYDHFFRYTSGRWIYNERERERLILFTTPLNRKLCRNAYSVRVL